MADVNRCKLYSTASSEQQRGIQAVVIYYVTMDGPTVGQDVIEKCNRISASDPDKDRVQRMDESFVLTIDGTEHVDNQLFVDDIRAEQRASGPDSRNYWVVTVTYKNPSLRSPTTPDDQRIDPLDRADEFWVEQLVSIEERDRGRNQQAIKWPWAITNADGNQAPSGKPAQRNVDEDGPVSNAAGFRYAPLPTIQRRQPVFVWKRNVSNPFSWIDINNKFFKKVNAPEPTPTGVSDTDDRAGKWNVFGTGQFVSPRTCLFWSIETSRPLYWGQNGGLQRVYYELEVRVLYDAKGHDIRYPNIGDKRWQDNRPVQEGETLEYTLGPVVSGGVPVPGPYALNLEGELRSNQAGQPDDLIFKDLDVARFSVLNTLINSLG